MRFWEDKDVLRTEDYWNFQFSPHEILEGFSHPPLPPRYDFQFSPHEIPTTGRTVRAQSTLIFQFSPHEILSPSLDRQGPS